MGGDYEEEIKELKRRYDVRFITLCDDLSLVYKERFLDFCDRLISENLDIQWSVTGRVNLVDGNILRKMRRAGCVEIGYGFESGNQKILDSLKKGVTVKQAEEAIKSLRTLGGKIESEHE